MISQIKVQNFKALKNVDVKLKGLTLLTGMNSSGKSSLIQMLLLMRANQDNLIEAATFKFNTILVDVGEVKDVIYNQKAAEFSFNIHFGKTEKLNVYSTKEDLVTL